MDKSCLDCGKELRGRSDKKFCDDLCRSNYNNRLLSENNSIVKQINNILKKNRQILERHNPEAKTRVKQTALSQAGFNFNYHTHIYETQKGSQYRFCYEYGYLPIDNGMVLLVKREEM